MKRGVHAGAWVLLAVAAFLLWPERWGGTMTYVITHGTSMQPQFEEGDLALLRAADDYRVGDVVGYRSAELKNIVMHRITAESEAGYTLQGDNNDFLDPETVTDEQMLGELVLRVPGVGNHLRWLLQPMNLLILGTAALFLLADRKREPDDSGQQPGGTLRLTSLDLPASAVTAELATECDLERLAKRCGRPVLDVGDQRYVVDGSVVYTWTRAAAGQARERSTGPQRRDWNHPRRHLQVIPAPRAGEDVRRVSSR